jgi:carbonic anhydrase/acetyltransferase-like protein (isoleucine patch superfamily)
MREGVKIVKGGYIDETVEIENPVLIEDNVSIAKGSRIGPYVVLKNGVKIGEDSIVENTILLEEADIGSLNKICQSIVGEKAVLSNRVMVDGSIIGPGSILGESVHVKKGSRIWSGVRVTPNTQVEGTLSLPTDKPFYFYSDIGRYIGATASTIYDLLNVLPTVEIASIEFHLYRRDFERWIRDVFQANVLTGRISLLRKEELRGEELRKKLITTVRDWLDLPPPSKP